MRNMGLWAVAVLGFVLGCENDPYAEKRADRTEAIAERLREEIGAEIQSLGSHPWAGMYRYGNDLSDNVVMLLAPHSGVLFERRGCLGLYGRNYGTIIQNKDRLRLSFTCANKRDGLQGIADELLVVPWGERTYLVPADDVVGFCNAVNSGQEPRPSADFGGYLLRDGDGAKKVVGLPDVPSEFKPYLLAQPVKVEVIGVGDPEGADDGSEDSRVTLKGGKNRGLLPGMELYAVQSSVSFGYGRATITKVAEERSEAILNYLHYKKMLRAQIGWNLSTRLPWYPGSVASSSP